MQKPGKSESALKKEIYKTNSLNPKDLPLSERELQSFSLIVADIDYTLIDFDKGHKEGIKALSQIFGEQFAQEVSDMFHLILEGHRRSEDEYWKKREEFNKLMARMMELQKLSLPSFGPKVWSREAWILITAEKFQKRLTPQQIENGRDAYWMALSRNLTLYEDAKSFLQLINQLELPLILMTGSDSVLKVNEDYSLVYDPNYSEEYKEKRLSALPFSYQKVAIGDPTDKPDPRYFEKLFQMVRGFGNFPPENVLVVGDSERNDLQIPQQLGYTTLLIKRG